MFPIISCLGIIIQLSLWVDIDLYKCVMIPIHADGQNIPQNFTRRVGEVLRLLQSNTGHAHYVGHGVKAVDGWNNEQHGHFYAKKFIFSELCIANKEHDFVYIPTNQILCAPVNDTRDFLTPGNINIE